VLETVRDAQGRGRAIKDSRAAARSLVPIAEEIPSVRVVTYNIHTCVGVDRRYDPARIVAVLREIDADIACLQEVGARPSIGRHADQWAYLGEATGCRVILGAGIWISHARHGWFVVGPGENGMEYSVTLIACLSAVLWTYWPRER